MKFMEKSVIQILLYNFNWRKRQHQKKFIVDLFQVHKESLKWTSAVLCKRFKLCRNYKFLEKYENFSIVFLCSIFTDKKFITLTTFFVCFLLLPPFRIVLQGGKKWKMIWILLRSSEKNLYRLLHVGSFFPLFIHSENIVTHRDVLGKICSRKYEPPDSKWYISKILTNSSCTWFKTGNLWWSLTLALYSIQCNGKHSVL